MELIIKALRQWRIRTRMIALLVGVVGGINLMILATALGSVLALGASFLTAQNLMPFAPVRFVVRRILEADLWEISVVTFPMLPTARVSNVKHRRFYRDRETELVRLMRRAARSMANNHFTKG